MRLLFVADGRSPIALNWIRHFVEAGHEVHLASLYSCDPGLDLASLHDIPVAFSRFSGFRAASPAAGKSQERAGGAAPGLRSALRRLASPALGTALRQWSVPLTLPGASRRLQQVIQSVRPDLVHAMRIPYEGMLTSLTVAELQKPPPFLVSVWGNDFTLHALATPWLAAGTRRCLQQASALHADCHRDVRLAHAWGFDPAKPARVLPGAGGVQLAWFHPPAEDAERAPFPIVVNPRGFRAYVRNDTFFQSVPYVLAQKPETRFLCPNMAQERQAHVWVERLNLAERVTLMPRQSRVQMAELFRWAQLTVSPTTHDGTPNTLLEAMACGSLPVAGDLESIREWIVPGLNGLLVDTRNPSDLAQAILLGLEQDELRERAARMNQRMILERAEHGRVMQAAGEFYRELIEAGN